MQSDSNIKRYRSLRDKGIDPNAQQVFQQRKQKRDEQNFLLRREAVQRELNKLKQEVHLREREEQRIKIEIRATKADLSRRDGVLRKEKGDVKESSDDLVELEQKIKNLTSQNQQQKNSISKLESQIDLLKKQLEEETLEEDKTNQKLKELEAVFLRSKAKRLREEQEEKDERDRHANIETKLKGLELSLREIQRQKNVLEQQVKTKESELKRLL
jgi:chromosome segregation ATPase